MDEADRREVCAARVEAVEAIEGRMAVGLDADRELPAEIMVMPGGVHLIHATKGKEDVSVKVLVDARTAEVLNAAFQEHRKGPQRPWFDFDHELKGPASAWPTEFMWKAAPRPGVYARVEWSAAGKEAVQGRNYRGFSPRFFVDKSDPARVTGAPLNMGGLVNDPAFQEISPLFARKCEPHRQSDTEGTEERRENKREKHMTEQELAALQARLNELEKENGELKAKHNTAALEAKHNTALQGKDSEIARLKEENKTLGEAIKARAKQDADAAVKAAVARGAIAPKNEALQAKWRAMIEADASNAELLNAMAGNPALTPVTAASVHGAAGAQGGTVTGNSGEATAEEFVGAVQAAFKARAGQADAANEPLAARKSKAMDAAVAANPGAYAAWREAGGKPGLSFN